MVFSATVGMLILTLLATQWVRTIQTFPDSLQALDAVSSNDLVDHAGQGVEGEMYDLEGNPEGEPDVLLNDLWSDISSAFQFLEDKPMDDKLKAKLLAHEIELIRMREKAKRLQLPINQHNFVRFGKRSSPNIFNPRENLNVPSDKREYHSFVRFGKRQATRGTDLGPFTIGNSDQWQFDVEGRRHFIRPNQLNPGLEEMGNMERQHSFPHSEHSNLEQFQKNFFDSLVHRFRRSSSSQGETAVSSSEKPKTSDSPSSVDARGSSEEKLEPMVQSDSDKTTTGDSFSALRSWQQYAKRRLANARIGRLPASVFYPQWMKMNSEDQPKVKSSQESSFLTQSPSFDLNILPRYG